MKKLFISCPMKNRTKKNIDRSMEKMHKLAEIIFDQELEVIPTWIDEEPTAECVNPGVWYLGKSIELLAQADYFIGIQYRDFFNGCDIEARTARAYGIKSTYVELCEIMPDAQEIVNEYYRNETCSPAPISC